MPLPDSFLQHLTRDGYHPRSNKHSNELAVAVVEELIRRCAAIADRASQCGLVYDLNMDLRVRTANWNVDLVLGTPAQVMNPSGEPIVRATPSSVLIAIEIKSVMTEHRKAVKNRKRDFEAHHDHVHNYNATAVAGALMIINAASSFVSPLRQAPTQHGSSGRLRDLVEHCVNEMRNVTESGARSTYGMDAKGVLVVEFDNVPGSSARYLVRSPAPRPGDPLHYDSFIQKICSDFTRRFGA